MNGHETVKNPVKEEWDVTTQEKDAENATKWGNGLETAWNGPERGKTAAKGLECLENGTKENLNSFLCILSVSNWCWSGMGNFRKYV